jgi:hypothetical protein
MVVYWSFRGFFKILCLVSALIDTHKKGGLKSKQKIIFLTYCFMVKTNISKNKGADIYLAGISLNKI